MGFRFRKTLRLGPINVNIGKSGVGYSVGTNGARIGKSSNGRSYSSFGIPGTGMSWRTEGKNGQGCLSVLILMVIVLVYVIII